MPHPGDPVPASPPAAAEEEPVRVLLVEADPGDARLIADLLRRAAPFPFEIAHVQSLDEGLRRLAAGGVDAALLDLSLGGAGRLDAVHQALSAAPQVPLVVLTDVTDEHLGLRAVRGGAQDYLVKGEITGRLLAHSLRYAIERARLERERAALLHREQRARSLAERAVRSREQVLGIVAHDLRTPLAAINTTAALLLQDAPDGGRLAHHLHVVLRSTGQMDRLIQDLLDVARIQGGTLRVQRSPADPGALLDEACELLEPQAAAAGRSLRAEAPDGLPEVMADRQRVVQVLGNLAGNALRFAPAGTEVALRARTFGDSVLFSVTDAGPGIPADELPHLFDRLWQAEHARSGGTGRGLAISKGIVDAHGGRIWAVSEPGRGSTFFFTLPRAEGAAPAAEAAVAPGEARAEAGGAALRVLLVDDHTAIRRGLRELLERAGEIVVAGEAATGEEALAKAERVRPDVVVMDLALPGMGGIEATRQITASMPGVRVLALTAESEEEALLPVLRAGGSGFVRKTTAHADLLPALSAVARDDVFLYPTGSRLLLGELLSAGEPEDGPLAGLTAQERQILLLAAEGYNSTEIGRKLYLSPKTVDTYRSRLMRQIGLERRSDLVRFALRTGLLRAE